MTALVVALLAIMVLQPLDAQAQRRGGSRGGASGAWTGESRQPEFSVTYGSMWGGHINSSLGTLRIDTGDSWYFAANLPIATGTWGELSYTRQGTRINLDTVGPMTNLTDMTVHYWQIGTIKGLPRGNFMPYVVGTLGVTYYSPDADRVDIGNVTYGVESATKFSMTFGVGLKAVLGPEKRVGLRAQFRVLPTLYGASGGMWVGSGGSGVSISGSALWQYEVSAGLVIKLGR